MTQIVAAIGQLGKSRSGKVIGYKIDNLDGTAFQPFTTQDVIETSIPGTYAVVNGVTAPDDGGYMSWGESGGEYFAGTTIPSTAQDVWGEVLQGNYAVPTAGGILLVIYDTILKLLGVHTVPGLPTSEGVDLEIRRGDTWKYVFDTYDENMVGTPELWFSVKCARSDTDDEAVIQITKSTGLVRLNGDASTPAWGSIATEELQDENSQTYWRVTVSLKADATTQLTVRSGLPWDVQVKNSANSDVVTLIDGKASVVADVSRAIT